LEAVIPVGSEAEIVIPQFNLENVVIREGDQVIWDGKAYGAGVAGVQSVDKAQGNFIIKVGSGRYDLRLNGD
jgi:hypothetical protein